MRVPGITASTTEVREPRIVRVLAAGGEEDTVVAHLRGDCHNGTVCAICKAERRAFKAERALDSVITGGAA